MSSGSDFYKTFFLEMFQSSDEQHTCGFSDTLSCPIETSDSSPRFASDLLPSGVVQRDSVWGVPLERWGPESDSESDADEMELMSTSFWSLNGAM